jgi:membrane protease YdiL (CAAX protease family)
MEEQWTSQVLLLLALGGMLSLITLRQLYQKQRQGGLLLPYEARYRVPWGPGAVFVAIYIVVMNLFATGMVTDAHEPLELEPMEFVKQGWLNIGLNFFLSAMIICLLIMVSKATWRDLGLPTGSKQCLADIRLGAIACAAALLPVLLLSQIAQWIFHPTTQHPFLEQIAHTPSPMIFLTAAGAAILAAPLSEELIFRLLLQGGLERFEDQWLGFTATERKSPVQRISSHLPPRQEIEAGAPAAGTTPVAGNPPVTGNHGTSDNSAGTLENSLGVHPPEDGPLPDLPFGWAPILASGLLFSLAHFGHGADPIPLFALGIVLGYLYQRTHRLIPCITAHMLFNSFSLALAWLMLG